MTKADLDRPLTVRDAISVSVLVFVVFVADPILGWFFSFIAACCSLIVLRKIEDRWIRAR